MRKSEQNRGYRLDYFAKPRSTAESNLSCRLDRELNHELLWESYAVSYDKVVGLMPYYRATIRRHMRLLQARNPAYVADLGAGTGTLALAAARRGYRVLAVDVSRSMMQRLAEKSGNRTISERICVLQQSAESLSAISDGAFDGVSVLLALFDMAHPERALWEAIRILAPGGIIVITEPRITFRMDSILSFCKNYLREQRVWSDLSEDYDRVFKANWAIDPSSRASGSPLRIENIQRVLAAAGFSELRLLNSHFGNCGTLVGYKPARLRYQQFESALAEMGTQA